jgi:ABC-type transport system involved in cytochrome bd biosynthesis fused ATPase/permease subunit
MQRLLTHLGQTYRYGPAQVLGIAGLLAIFGALFAEGWWWQAVLVNIGTTLLLIPPIIIYERLIVSEEVREVRNTLEEQLAELRKMGTHYEHIREALPPTEERTSRFEQIFEKVKEQAKDTDINAEKARDLFKLPFGDRLVVLASAQVKQNPELFPQVIEAIEHSITAFEQAKALEAAEVMLPKLSEAQKQRLVDVINENPWISEDSRYRWAVSRRILKKLGH